MYGFHQDYIKNKCGNNSRLLFANTASLLYETKTKYVYEDFNKNKNLFNFSSYSTKSKFYDDSNKLVVGKMKNELAGVPIKEFVGLKPKMYSFLVDYSSEHKRANSANKNNVATRSHNEYILLNQKRFRHSINKIQSNNHSIGNYKINKFSLLHFDDKTHIKNNGYDGLALDYQGYKVSTKINLLNFLMVNSL